MEDNKDLKFGIIAFFSSKKGYGFIIWEENGVKCKDMFLHYSDIEMQGFKTAFKDQKVSFEIGATNKGEPKAIKVKILLH